jgi:hypothetical protein
VPQGHPFPQLDGLAAQELDVLGLGEGELGGDEGPVFKEPQYESLSIPSQIQLPGRGEVKPSHAPDYSRQKDTFSKQKEWIKRLLKSSPARPRGLRRSNLSRRQVKRRNRN